MVNESDSGNETNIIASLKYLQSLDKGQSRLIVIWDGASYHRSHGVQNFLRQVKGGLPPEEWKITCLRLAPNAPEPFGLASTVSSVERSAETSSGVRRGLDPEPFAPSSTRGAAEPSKAQVESKIWWKMFGYRQSNSFVKSVVHANGLSPSNSCLSSSRIVRPSLLEALKAALGQRGPNPAGLLFHSDRGSQYATHPYPPALDAAGMTCSMRHRGNCWDNAVAESFFSTLKTERVNPTTFITPQAARTALAEWIEVFYNRQRRHSALGFLAPGKFEQQYLDALKLKSAT